MWTPVSLWRSATRYWPEKPLARSQATTLLSRRPAAASFPAPKGTWCDAPAFRSWRDRSDSGVWSRLSAGKETQGWTNCSLQTPGPGADRGSGVADRERPTGEGIDRDGDRGLALGECEIVRQRIARLSPSGQARSERTCRPHGRTSNMDWKPDPVQMTTVRTPGAAEQNAAKTFSHEAKNAQDDRPEPGQTRGNSVSCDGSAGPTICALGRTALGSKRLCLPFVVHDGALARNGDRPSAVRFVLACWVLGCRSGA